MSTTEHERIRHCIAAYLNSAHMTEVHAKDVEVDVSAEVEVDIESKSGTGYVSMRRTTRPRSSHRRAGRRAGVLIRCRHL